MSVLSPEVRRAIYHAIGAGPTRRVTLRLWRDRPWWPEAAVKGWLVDVRRLARAARCPRDAVQGILYEIERLGMVEIIPPWSAWRGAGSWAAYCHRYGHPEDVLHPDGETERLVSPVPLPGWARDLEAGDPDQVRVRLPAGVPRSPAWAPHVGDVGVSRTEDGTRRVVQIEPGFVSYVRPGSSDPTTVHRVRADSWRRFAQRVVRWERIVDDSAPVSAC